MTVVAEPDDSSTVVEMIEFEDAVSERMAQLEQEDLERYQRDLDLQRRIVRMRRPIQRFEMRVPDYYTRFCYWKEEMISLGYPDDESSFLDDFIGNLQWNIQLRVNKRRSRIRRLVDAYYEAKFEETTILLERMVKDLKAATEISEMVDRFPTKIQGDGICDSVDDDSIVNNQRAIPYVQTPKANIAEPYAHKSFDDMPRSLSIELKEEDADSDGSGNCDEQHPDEEIQSNDYAIKNAEDGNHFSDKLLPNSFVKYEETELNGGNGCVVWCKTDAHIDADKVFVEMIEPVLEEGLLGIEATKDTHYMFHVSPMISPIDSDADWYEKYASMSSFPYSIEPSNGDNASNWVSGSFTNISIAQNFSYENVVLGDSVTKFPLLSLLEFSPQVFDPGTITPLKQDCENEGQLHCAGPMFFPVAFSHRFEYVNQASRNLFDYKAKQYSSKQKFGVEGLGQPASETWESHVSNFTRDLCFKDDGTIMFVPGISPLHLTGCAPLNSGEMPGISAVHLSIAKVMFCFNPDSCCLFENECDHFELNIDLYVDSEVKGAIYDSTITSSNLDVVVFDVVVLQLRISSALFHVQANEYCVISVCNILAGLPLEFVSSSASCKNIRYKLLCVASSSLNRDVQIHVFIGDEVIFVYKGISCWILFFDRWTDGMALTSSSDTYLCLWSHVQDVIPLYIIEDNDVLKRKGIGMQLVWALKQSGENLNGASAHYYTHTWLLACSLAEWKILSLLFTSSEYQIRRLYSLMKLLVKSVGSDSIDPNGVKFSKKANDDRRLEVTRLLLDILPHIMSMELNKEMYTTHVDAKCWKTLLIISLNGATSCVLDNLLLEELHKNTMLWRYVSLIDRLPWSNAAPLIQSFVCRVSENVEDKNRVVKFSTQSEHEDILIILLTEQCKASQTLGALLNLAILYVLHCDVPDAFLPQKLKTIEDAYGGYPNAKQRCIVVQTYRIIFEDCMHTFYLSMVELCHVPFTPIVNIHGNEKYLSMGEYMNIKMIKKGDRNISQVFIENLLSPEAAMLKVFLMALFLISCASYSLWQYHRRRKKCWDTITQFSSEINLVTGHLRFSYYDATNEYLQNMEQHGESLAEAYLRGTHGASHEIMIDTGLTPNAPTFFTTKLEHYIWDPGWFVSVS